jgi:hypothetical protein
MKSVGIAFALAVAVVVAIACRLLRSPAEATTAPIDAPAPSSVAAASAPAAESSDVDDAARSAARLQESATAASPEEVNPYRGEGAITVKFVDAVDDSPIADLPFLVYSERPSLHVYTRAITDDHGEATIRELPEDVVIFESRRRPPLANTIFATWLSPRQRKQIVVRVGHGGTVRGRVVDDLGHPIGDAEVVIDARPGNENVLRMQSVQSVDEATRRRFADTEEIIARTSTEGRFEVGAVLSRPAAIWIEHGAMAPKREDKFRVWFRTDLQMVWSDVLVHENETIDLGDVAIARPIRFAGRVLLPDGTAASGALVSSRSDRFMELGRRIVDARWSYTLQYFGPGLARRTDFALRPGEKEFAAQRGETLTGGDGSFDVEAGGTPVNLLVAMPDGQRQWFSQGVFPPGTRVDGLELRMKWNSLLVLEVVGPDGAPLPDATTRGGKLDRLEVTGFDAAGTSATADTRRIDSMRFACEVWTPPTELRRLVVTATDFEPTEIAFDAPPAPRARVAVTLVSRASFALHLKFRFEDPVDWKRLGESSIVVRAGPRPHPNDESSMATEHLQAKRAHEATLLMRSEREWFLTAEGPFGESADSFESHDLGSFRPDSTVHEVTLPPISAAWVARREQEQKEREESERNQEPKPAGGIVLLSAVDRETGEAVPTRSMHLDGEDSSGNQVQAGVSRSNEVGKTELHFALGPGRYRMRLRAMQYRASEPIDFEAKSNETTDLGELRLERQPSWKLRVVPSEGDSMEFPSIRVLAADETGTMQERFYVENDASGGATIFGDVPQSLVVLVQPNSRGAWFGGGDAVPARFDLERWDRGEVKQLPLPHWRPVRVVVDLSAIDADLRDTACYGGLRLRADESDAPRAAVRGDGAGDRARRVDASHARMTFFAPAGRYQLRASGPFLEVAPVDVEVPADSDPPETTVIAAMK